MKTLVVYYSRTGNTRLVAQEIVTALNADVEELHDEKNRRGIACYITGGRDAFMRKETTLKPLKHKPSDYDLIVVGTPVWSWNVTPAVRTFLSKNKISGKKVALFCTNGGPNPGKTFGSMREYLGGSKVVSEMSVRNSEMSGTYKRKTREWSITLR